VVTENEKPPETDPVKKLQAQLRGANRAREVAENAMISAEDGLENAEAKLEQIQKTKSLSKGKHEHMIRTFKDINYQKPWFEVCGQTSDTPHVACEGEVLARRRGAKVLFKNGIGITNNRDAAVELSTTLYRTYIEEHPPLCPECGKDMDEDTIDKSWFCPDAACDGKRISMKGNKR